MLDWNTGTVEGTEVATHRSLQWYQHHINTTRVMRTAEVVASSISRATSALLQLKAAQKRVGPLCISALPAINMRVQCTGCLCDENTANQIYRVYNKWQFPARLSLSPTISPLLAFSMPLFFVVGPNPLFLTFFFFHSFNVYVHRLRRAVKVFH
jgi:hypothetical protein